MATFYADSSVLVKRHVPELGTAWVRNLAAPTAANTIITTQISLVELYSALNRRVREKSVTALRYKRIQSVISYVWSAQYETVELTDKLIGEAKLLLERHPLRAYDAVQLASAIQARMNLLIAGFTAPVFLSADDRLLLAAQAEGFITDNPNLH